MYMKDHFQGNETATAPYTAAIRTWLDKSGCIPPSRYDARALKTHVRNWITAELSGQIRKNSLAL